ncbi:membrane protein insertion efficiency factor YidD [candidate division KSB1 bacterium]|nr:membrane protein insertion efficiency factor YidD [candidate division KSB1 bacterium]
MVVASFYTRVFSYIIMGFLIYHSCSFAQINSDLNFIINHNPVTTLDSKKKISLSFDETSELKITCMGMIRFYQIFVSSQQNNQAICTFTPSCSRFGFAAIKKYGPFYGILMTSDRLQRCHGFSRSHYPTHPETGKFFDPIELYKDILK